MMNTRLVKKLCAGLLLAGLLATPAQAETVTYLHTDLLGSVVLETDQNRNIVQRYEYEPYGLPRQAMVDQPGYTGHVHDAGSGLVYMQQRYYDPEVGRFLSVDPVGVDLATGANFNRYWYGNNNPYTYTDPDGRNAIAGAAAGCGLSGPGCPFGAVVGAVIGTAIGVVTVRVFNEIVSGGGPEVPGSLVGEQDDIAGAQGGRHNSGPLSTDHGGTGDAGKDFEKLTGGKAGPAPEDKNYPEGTVVGENGISLRPATDKSGPRIDIPAKGDKPAETLHYPKPSPPPPEPKL
jgi:RHS repeat-associated protein